MVILMMDEIPSILLEEQEEDDYDDYDNDDDSLMDLQAEMLTRTIAKSRVTITAYLLETTTLAIHSHPNSKSALYT